MKYKSLLFDCDGVLLDSNRVKTESFRDLLADFPSDAIEEFCAYHQANTGISRFVKIRHFFEEIIKETSLDDEFIGRYIDKYGEIVLNRLRTCPLVPGVLEFLLEQKDLPKFIISGGLESELIEIFRDRKMIHHFKAICGSPRSKDRILSDMTFKIERPAYFFGDSRYDYDIATRFDLGFTFVSGYTEMQDWREFVHANKIFSISDFTDPELKSASFFS